MSLPATDQTREAGGDAITATQVLAWLLFAFVPSSMMLAVTSKISTDVGSIPLIWVVPLALYLLTFVSGIIIEWMDVLFTYQTVRTYKRMKATRSRRVIEVKKKEASGVYKCSLLIALITSAIVPLIAFAKANCETDYFAPKEF